MQKLDQRGFAEKAAVTAHSTGTETKIGEVEREEKRMDESKETNVHIKRAVKSL